MRTIFGFRFKKLFGGLCLIYFICLSTTNGFVHSGPPNEKGNQCTALCITEMQALVDSTPYFKPTDENSASNKGKSIVDIAKTSFFDRVGGNDKNSTFELFNKICHAYSNVDACLTGCDKNRQQNDGDIRQAYAGLEFICKERKADFFEALPCLAEYEPSAMLKCKQEINKSQESTVLFTNAIMNREFQVVSLRFSTLCRDLSVMMKCMEPTIRRGCGDRPTNLMLTFIGLEFASFEKLNEHLGFDHPLPNPCRSLIHYSNERRLTSRGQGGVRGRLIKSQPTAAERNAAHSIRRYFYGTNVNLVTFIAMLLPFTCSLGKLFFI
ncbi:chondroitin proteoglycan 4 domain-containing protein [Ditylenchus destructor]|nr:chondroitin proteoglycan 4 domain-containing protein [Ditylenchus destructor]